MSPEIADLVARLIEFRDARHWRQFHTVKNLASALSVEAAELLELTQWKTPEELDMLILTDRNLNASFAEEIADVFIYLLLICERLKIDPVVAAEQKLQKNETRYPIEKSRGTARKYYEL
jgi:NTP pyrophosphatase (non-canonical NTP hydrolase)